MLEKMKQEDVTHVINDLNSGKCNMSLRSLILLNNKDNLEFLNQRLTTNRFLPMNVDFYHYYNEYYITPDGLIYHSINHHIYLATIHGQIDLLKSMLPKCACDYNMIMSDAAEYGHLDIVHLMLNHGANKYALSAYKASSSGHLEIFKLMLTKIANIKYYDYMSRAAKYHHLHIVRYLLDNQHTLL